MLLDRKLIMRKNSAGMEIKMKTRKIITGTLCAVMAFSLAACMNSNKPVDKNEIGTKAENAQQMPNPFITCDTLEEAIELAGFDMTVPESLEGFEDRMISAIENELIQVTFQNEENQIYFRKAEGDEDISGDYNVYSEVNTVETGGKSVTMKGNDGKVMLAVWTANGYTYAVRATEVSLEEMSGLAEQLQ